jgi:hypothetical protein
MKGRTSIISIPVQDLQEPAPAVNTKVAILYIDESLNDQFTVGDQRACTLRPAAAGCTNAIRFGRYSGVGSWAEGKANSSL